MIWVFSLALGEVGDAVQDGSARSVALLDIATIAWGQAPDTLFLESNSARTTAGFPGDQNTAKAGPS